MDDPIFKTKYHKYKTKVKLWEKSFKELNGRVPSKYDIREAPSAIRDSYKMYYKLKTSFLEETLSDALDEDSFDLSILESSSQTDPRLSSSFSEISTPDVSALTSENSIILQNASIDALHSSNPINIAEEFHQPNGKEFEAEAANALNEKAWVRKTNSVNDKTATSNNPLRKSMSDKLFRNSSFLKRNPRKSLSRNSLTSSQSSQSSLTPGIKENFPDLETILSQKSKQQENEEIEEQPAAPKVLLDKKITAPNLANNIDVEWLNRCNKANGIDCEPSATNIALTENRPKTFGISNINVAALANLERKQSIMDVGPKTMLSFDMENLDLTAQNSFIGNGAVISQQNDSELLDDDEEIANSEDESDMNSSRLIRSMRNSTKRKHNEIDREIPTKIAAKSDKPSMTIATDNNLKKQTTTLRKTRSNTKLQPLTNSEPPSEAKPKPKQRPSKPKLERKPSENKVQVAVVTRKSSRNVNNAKTYTEPTLNDVKSDEDEEDPFAGDDSDNDPNFSVSQSPNSKTMRTNGKAASSSESSADEQPKPTEETVVGRKKRVSRVKGPVKPRVKAEKKVSMPKKTKKQAMKPNPNSSISENEHQETPDDYLIEFGMEQIKGVPRIPVTELEQNTMEFTKYICNAPLTDKPVKAAEATQKSQPTNIKRAIAKDKLQNKIAAGTLNENYVRLNLRKKVFVRGKKTMNFSRYKKKLWKSKKAAALTGPEMDMGGCDGGILTCFQCGLPGHFAQNCKVKSDRLLPLTAEEESPFPTLQEVEEMSTQQIKIAHFNRELPQTDNPTWKINTEASEGATVEATASTDTVEGDEMMLLENESDKLSDAKPTQTYIGHQIPEEFLIKARLVGNETKDESQVDPLYELNADGTLRDTPHEVYEALAMFGHKEFRSGQEKAVMRILSGQSTLVTLSTGSGKSLCYQLPAYMYSRQKRCITLVISPLVSLMEDQVQGVPHFLNAKCLHTNLSEQKRAATIEAIKAGEVDVLLISPEAVVSSEKSTGFGSILRDLPPVAFVCIDECHCVSQFGHNFRPSYLMVCRVLYEKLKVKTVLGLTATATISTRLSIVEHLRIPDGLDGVISDIPLPDNLTLSISCDDNRDIALVKLLREPRFVEFQSIIIYCSRRDECERVAKNLRTYFQDNIARELELRNSTGKRKRTLKTTIEPYHAGMAGSRRRTIQNQFMRGDLKIVVATIAFGMGINKADIRCVIHYNMPMNFESYVQEVGRAGRDGKPAHCHLFLDSKGEDKVELRRHIYANSIDRHIIRKLLRKIFIPCACKKPTETTTMMSDIDACGTPHAEWQ